MDFNFMLVGFQLINILLLILGIAGFILFILVLFKANRALDIWLEQNKKDNHP